MTDCEKGVTLWQMLEQLRTIDKSRVIRFMGKLKPEKMREIDAALEVSLGLHIPEGVEAP